MDIKGRCFWKKLALAAQISLWYFFVVGELLLKSFVVDGYTLVCAGTGFGVGTLVSLK